MAQACRICTHPNRDTIDADLQAGQSLRDVAARYGIPKSSLDRHKQGHMQGLTAAHPSASTGTTGTATPLSHVPAAPVPPSPRSHTRKPGEHIKAGELGTTQRIFLEAFAQYANETDAIRTAHIDRTTVRWWEEHDPAFSLRYQEAQRQVDDAIDSALFLRGVLGVDEPVVSMGKIVYDPDTGKPMTQKKYSDTVLLKLAAARMPGKYKDKTAVDVTSNGQTIQTGGGVSPDEFAALQATIRAELLAWRKGQGYGGEGGN